MTYLHLLRLNDSLMIDFGRQLPLGRYGAFRDDRILD